MHTDNCIIVQLKKVNIEKNLQFGLYSNNIRIEIVFKIA